MAHVGQHRNSQRANSFNQAVLLKELAPMAHVVLKEKPHLCLAPSKPKATLTVHLRARRAKTTLARFLGDTWPAVTVRS